MNEKQIIQKLQSKDKDEILDIPTLLINEKSINLNALIAVATEEKLLSEILSLIDIANLLECKDEYEEVLAAHCDENFEERTIEDAIFPYKEFRKTIKRSFLEQIEKRWNIKIGFTYDDFYKVYRDYHLLPYHGERLKIYFGDVIEI
jgi:hypothetical protein